LQKQTTCNTAESTTRCRTLTRVPDGNDDLHEEKVGDPADPSTQLEVTYMRDTFGNVIHVKAVDGDGDVRESCTTYEPEGLFHFARVNAEGHVTLERFDAATGAPLGVTDHNVLTTSWSVDGFGRVA